MKKITAAEKAGREFGRFLGESGYDKNVYAKKSIDTQWTGYISNHVRSIPEASDFQFRIIELLYRYIPDFDGVFGTDFLGQCNVYYFKPQEYIEGFWDGLCKSLGKSK